MGGGEGCSGPPRLACLEASLGQCLCMRLAMRPSGVERGSVGGGGSAGGLLGML